MHRKSHALYTIHSTFDFEEEFILDWTGNPSRRGRDNAEKTAVTSAYLIFDHLQLLKFTHLIVPVIIFVCSVMRPPSVLAQGNPGPVRGEVYVGATNMISKNVSMLGKLFVPRSTHRVRAVIVLANYNLFAQGLFYDQHWRGLAQSCQCALLWMQLNPIRPISWKMPISRLYMRNAGVGGADALFLLLRNLGTVCNHHELRKAPLLFWGWSATASFGTTFAELYPKRTVAFIRYHTHRRGLPATVGALKAIPALLIAGGKDGTAGIKDAESFWKMARASDAPWTFAIEPNGGHSSDPLVYQTSDELVVPWIAGVIRLRLPPEGTKLRPVTNTVGWLGNNATGQIGPAGSFHGSETATSWIPDHASAQGWLSVVRLPK